MKASEKKKFTLAFDECGDHTANTMITDTNRSLTNLKFNESSTQPGLMFPYLQLVKNTVRFSSIGLFPEAFNTSSLPQILCVNGGNFIKYSYV